MCAVYYLLISGLYGFTIFHECELIRFTEHKLIEDFSKVPDKSRSSRRQFIFLSDKKINWARKWTLNLADARRTFGAVISNEIEKRERAH